MNNKLLRFNYKINASSTILMVVGTFALTASIGYIAYTTPDLRLTRLLELVSPEFPSLFFWSLTALTSLCCIFAVHFAFSSLNSIGYVELGPNGAFVPSASLSMTPITIPYRSIKQIQVVKIEKHQMAIISSSIGEARILSKFSSSPRDFTEFLLALEQRRHGL